MAPPFLAYYGVVNQNQSLVTESYNQIKLYRSYLRDSSADNLWKHIQLGDGTDDGHWSTGEHRSRYFVYAHELMRLLSPLFLYRQRLGGIRDA